MPLAPGMLFADALHAPERQFLAALLKSARRKGFYERLVEPAAGAFAICQLAGRVGWDARQFEASDITLFSALMAAGVVEPEAQAASLAQLGLEVSGIEEVRPAPDLSRAAEALWLMSYLMQRGQSTNLYAQALTEETLVDRARHVAQLEATLAKAAMLLRGMRYRSVDLRVALLAALDDPTALVVLNPPRVKATPEKVYDMQGCLRWREPDFRVFDPAVGIEELWEQARDARALVVICQERTRGSAVGDIVYTRENARGKGADAQNVYIVANRATEVTRLLDTRGPVLRVAKPEPLQGLNLPILPLDYQPTDTTRVELLTLKEPQTRYYRQLWTHTFQPSGASDAFALLLDGQVAGVFGYQTTWTFWHDPSRLFLLFNMAAPTAHSWRYTRLLKWVALSRDLALSILPPLVQSGVQRVFTTQLTRHAESMDMRGVMELFSRTPDREHGFKLVYEAPLRDWSLSDAYAHWLRDERASQQRRARLAAPLPKRAKRERR